MRPWGKSQIEHPTFRYTRRRDRWLAIVWPPRRKRLRMMNQILDMNLSEIQAEVNRIHSERLVFGTSYIKLKFTPN